MQTIRQLSKIVSKNIREMEKDVPKLEEMSFAVDSISSVYFSKTKGVFVLNDYVSTLGGRPRRRNEVFENEWMGHYKQNGCGTGGFRGYKCRFAGTIGGANCGGWYLPGSKRRREKEQRDMIRMIFNEALKKSN